MDVEHLDRPAGFANLAILRLELRRAIRRSAWQIECGFVFEFARITYADHFRECIIDVNET